MSVDTVGISAGGKSARMSWGQFKDLPNRIRAQRQPGIDMDDEDVVYGPEDLFAAMAVQERAEIDAEMAKAAAKEKREAAEAARQETRRIYHRIQRSRG